MKPSEPTDELALLIRSRHPLITIETVEEKRALEFVMRACAQLELPKFRWTVTTGLQRTRPYHDLPVTDTEDPTKLLGHIRHSTYGGVYVLVDLLPHLTNPVDKRLFRETVEHAEKDGQTLILIEQHVDLQPALERIAVPFEVALPAEREIRDIVQQTAYRVGGPDVDVEIKRSEYDALVNNLRGLTEQEIRRAVWRVVLDDGRLDGKDVGNVLQMKQEMIRELGMLEYIEPEVELDDIGGLDHLKDWLIKRKRGLSKEAREFGLQPPKGMLLLGVQGAGKSMCAKAVAGAWNLPLLRLDPSNLYDKYIGESEKQLQHALRTAEALSPVVLWIDEIEKGFASAAGQSTDGGLSRRMFGSLLSWMQDNDKAIFIVATANDISALPPELLRKGRFDELFFVDLPGREARAVILDVHLRRRNLDPDDFDLDKLADQTGGLSGAEIEQTIVSALYSAIADDRELDTRAILNEIAETIPLSVTMRERVAELRRFAKGRFVPA
jgi:ATP-dependent 26S proteasome regulatory subunit